MLKGNWLLCALTHRPQWTLVRTRTEIVAERTGGICQFSFDSISDIRVKKFLFWSHLTISYQQATSIKSVDVSFLGTRKSKEFKSELEDIIVHLLSERLKRVSKEVNQLHSEVVAFQKKRIYFRCGLIRAFGLRLLSSDNVQILRKARYLSKRPYVGRTNFDIEDLLTTCRSIEDSVVTDSNTYKKLNEDFVKSELASNHPILAKLSEDQKIAAITLEDRNLLVASAGSGKSWTLVGKAGYLIERVDFKPSEIIALAFNAAAAQELNERIERELKPLLGGQKVKVHTFHALGAGILRSVARDNGARIRVLGSSRKGEKGDEKRASKEKEILKGIIEDLKKGDQFRSDWLFFLTLCSTPVPMDDAFESHEEYQAYVQYQKKERSGGRPAKFQTMAGEIVESSEELAIANWLWTHSVPYKYEEHFHPIPEGWAKFQPDFYYPEIGVWHEHFGLNKDGKAPSFFESPAKYEEQAKFKEKWFADHVPDNWFSTKSADYRDGSLFDKLSEAMKEFKQPTVLRSDEEVLNKIKSLRQLDEVDLIARILHIIRGNGYDENFVRDCVGTSSDHFRAEAFIRIYWPIQRAYEKYLDKDPKKMDFDDMIIKAASALEERAFKAPYRLVMVDEFQDMSAGRARLVKALLAQHEDSVLFGVGDDWQAINGFAGSDLRLFLDFEKSFGATWEGKLSETYRCAQGIANVSSMFVEENSAGQIIGKKVKSPNNPTSVGTVDLVPVYWHGHVESIIGDRVAMLRDVAIAEGRDKENPIVVLILGRFGFEKTRYLSPEWLEQLNNLHEGVQVKYLTVHKSKGLEADHVFCVGLNKTASYSFPSTFENDPLVEMLMQGKDTYPHAEERRLFYVALTRAKRKVTLIFEERCPSSFVLELMGKKYRDLVRFNGGEDVPSVCGKCERGYLKKRSGEWRCSRYDESNPKKGCNHAVKLTNLAT